MNKRNRINIIIGLFLCLFLVSFLSQSTQNVMAGDINSDDSDIEAILHSRLETDSDEIIIYNSGSENESLMSTGTYSFFETPELDVGVFNHDLTQINVEELQYADENSNNKKSGSMILPVNQTWNHTTNSIPEYDISAPKDTIISTNIDYNFTNFENKTVNINPNGDYSTNWLSEPYGTHYTCIDEGETPNTGDYIFKYGACTDTFHMQNISAMKEQEVVIKLECKVYARFQDASNSYLYIYGNYPSLYEKNVELTTSWTWHTIQWDNLTLTTSEINNLKISLRKTSNPKNLIATMYSRLTIQNKSIQITPFKAIQVNNFKYQILGTNYTQTFNLTYYPSKSNYTLYKETDVLTVYYFTSAILDNYDHISNLKILNQTLTLTFYFWFPETIFQYSINMSWSQNEWRYPTVINLEINGNEVIDEDVGTGYVSLLTYPSSLIITSSSSNIYFKLNITSYFTFTFNLEIMSKTILMKSFKLLSDHTISINRIDFNSNLNIKNIYLNSPISRGNSNPCYLTPPEEMDTNQIFTLEVMLSESIYLLLQYFMNTLGGGSADVYLVGTSNTMMYSGISKNYNINPLLASGMSVDYANFLFSSLYYAPYYVSDDSNNLNDYGYNTQMYGEENVSFSSVYYQTNENATKISEKNDPYYYQESSVPANDSFDMNKGSHISNGTLGIMDNDYTVFNSSLGFLTKKYLATFSFENDTIGSIPNNWSEFRRPDQPDNPVPNGVINELDGHSKVLELCPNGTWQGYIQYTENQTTTGFYEYYVRVGQTNLRAMQILGYGEAVWGTFKGIHLEMYSNGNWYYIDDGGFHDTGVGYLAETWYHVRVEFDLSDDWHVWVNNVSLDSGVGYSFRGSPTYLGEFRMNLGGITPQTMHIDALGYSWFDYEKGDNLKPYSQNAHLNFTKIIQFNNNTLDPADSLQSFKLNYGQKVNATLTNFSLNIWNFTSSEWNLVNNTIDNNFYNSYFNLTSDYYNATNYIILNWFGNLSTGLFEFYLDLLLLISNWSYYDPDFDGLSSLWVSDTLVISDQSITTYWNVFDGNSTNVIINQTYTSTTTTIFTVALLNNTIQSQSWNNISSGFYEINLFFFNVFGNYLEYTVNYTIKGKTNIAVAYQNPQIIGLTNEVDVNIFSGNSIIDVYYGNSTDYVHQYSNTSYPLYSYDFTFDILHSTTIVYNISILIISEDNDIFWMNISNLEFIQAITVLEYHQFYSSYYQDDNVNITVQLRDMYNNPLENKEINYTIEAPNGTIIINSSGITNSSGLISIPLALSISYPVGFYHVNCTFNGTDDYTGVWKLRSFDLLPISRSVNAIDINMSINEFNLTSNSIRINSSNEFVMDCLDNSTFDLQVQYSLNYSENISYEDYLEYSFIFSSTDNIISWQITTANLTGYPTNFTHYYYDNSLSTNYVEIGNTFIISDLIGDTLYNNNNFEIDLVYLHTDNIQREQITTTPTTESNSVVFKENLLADTTFGYWYLQNSYDVNSISLSHIRTSTTISIFEQEEDNYYFEQSTLTNDLFEATVDYQWNPIFNYTVITNNGTYTYIKIDYSADLNVENVNLILNLLNDDIYNENWTYSSNQSIITYKLTIPNVNFTDSIQTLYIEGFSSVPYVRLDDFINEDDFKISDEEWKVRTSGDEWRTIKRANWEDLEVYMYGYLELTKYSKAFIISNIEYDWVLDGIRYGSSEYDITSVGYFECPGWGSGITSAYLRFKTNPIEDLERKQRRERVVYEITSKFDLKDVDFIFYIEEDERYNKQDMIKQLKEEIDCVDIVEYYSIEDRIYYRIIDMDLDEGINNIVIKYKIENLMKYAWAFIIVGIAMIGFVIIYISYRYKDNKIIDYIRLDKIVKLFVWIKKSERLKLTKKYRLSNRKKRRGKK